MTRPRRRRLAEGCPLTVVLLVASPALALAGEDDAEDRRPLEVIVADELVGLMNVERVAAGVEPVERYEDEGLVAEANRDWIETREAHRIIDDLREDYRALGVRAGEVQFGGDLPTGDIVLAWLGSPSHAEVLLHPSATHVAIAVACPGREVYATAHLIAARPGDSSPTVAPGRANAGEGSSCREAAAQTGPGLVGPNIGWKPFVPPAVAAGLLLMGLRTRPARG